MSQAVLVGLLTAFSLIAAALAALFGVLWKANKDFALGKRTGDLADRTAESKRNDDLNQQNEGLRKEITQVWRDHRKIREDADDEIRKVRQDADDEIRKVRQAADLAAAQHESECDAWDAKEKSLLSKLGAALGRNAVQAQKLDQANAETGSALLGQAQAEGGLQQARRTISQFSSGSKISSGPQTPAGNCPEDYPDAQT